MRPLVRQRAGQEAGRVVPAASTMMMMTVLAARTPDRRVQAGAGHPAEVDRRVVAALPVGMVVRQAAAAGQVMMTEVSN